MMKCISLSSVTKKVLALVVALVAFTATLSAKEVAGGLTAANATKLYAGESIEVPFTNPMWADWGYAAESWYYIDAKAGNLTVKLEDTSSNYNYRYSKYYLYAADGTTLVATIANGDEAEIESPYIFSTTISDGIYYIKTDYSVNLTMTLDFTGNTGGGDDVIKDGSSREAAILIDAEPVEVPNVYAAWADYGYKPVMWYCFDVEEDANMLIALTNPQDNWSFRYTEVSLYDSNFAQLGMVADGNGSVGAENDYAYVNYNFNAKAGRYYLCVDYAAQLVLQVSVAGEYVDPGTDPVDPVDPSEPELLWTKQATYTNVPASWGDYAAIYTDSEMYDGRPVTVEKWSDNRLVVKDFYGNAYGSGFNLVLDLDADDNVTKVSGTYREGSTIEAGNDVIYYVDFADDFIVNSAEDYGYIYDAVTPAPYGQYLDTQYSYFLTWGEEPADDTPKLLWTKEAVYCPIGASYSSIWEDNNLKEGTMITVENWSDNHYVIKNWMNNDADPVDLEVYYDADGYITGFGGDAVFDEYAGYGPYTWIGNNTTAEGCLIMQNYSDTFIDDERGDIFLYILPYGYDYQWIAYYSYFLTWDPAVVEKYAKTFDPENANIILPETASAIDELMAYPVTVEGASAVEATNLGLLAAIYDESGDIYAIAMASKYVDTFGSVESDGNTLTIHFVEVAALKNDATYEAAAKKIGAHITPAEGSSATVYIAPKSFKADGYVFDESILMGYEFEGAVPTGIQSVTLDETLPVYDLSGRRVSSPVKGQIYIQNGKKVIK